jgi:hypothetical protein
MPSKPFVTVAHAAKIAERSPTQIRNQMDSGVLDWKYSDSGKQMVCRKSLGKYVRAIKSGRICRGNFTRSKRNRKRKQ